ncbi:low molecular weight protein arginine phosphatase [Macrococcus carouselicus]|uniref:Low molecular weight protein-tyrosine-phosphatase PtpB n=1 Tax=Macrococcus carouselicus TaxID=69969 RepID=A0A9Q8CK50_9STAP|nr:low molecular weight protein arginine phosphatase [Macrococcus carouselicus]TDL95407.1 low molecular weight protein arginine phosphatase [Macrococcus carouselicus]
MKIIFVCTGNTCRSPVAESIAKSQIAAHDFQSRGLSAFTGSPVSAYSAELIEKHDLPAAGSAALFTAEDIAADLILTMSSSHKAFILSEYPEANVYTLAEYASDSGMDIADPYGGNLADYEQMFTEIRKHIDNLAEKLKPFQ